MMTGAPRLKYLKYLGRRLLAALAVLLGISVVTFVLLRLVPGDALDAKLAETAVSAEQMAAMRETLGLNRSVGDQFIDYYAGLLRGDLGISLIQHDTRVLDQILLRLAATMELAAGAMLIAVLIGTALGTVSAVRQRTPADLFSRLFAVAGISMPNFWLALLLMLLFAVQFRLLPSGGYMTLGESVAGNLTRLLMPALTLGVGMAAVITRMLRSSLLEALSQDYVRTARAKGLGERSVVYRHALRNALIPTVTVLGLQMGHLMGGAIVVEHIFGWPGLGQLTVESVAGRDYPMVQAVVLFLAGAVVLSNLVVDLAYGYIDPRIRYQ